MIRPLLPAVLVLAAALGAAPRAGRQCAACGEPALDVQSHRDLLLRLAKSRILDQLRLRRRPTPGRPLPPAALRAALQRLHGPPQGALPEADGGQEYDIISFAETGGFLACRSSPKLHLLRKRKGSSPLTSDFLPKAIPTLASHSL